MDPKWHIVTGPTKKNLTSRIKTFFFLLEIRYKGFVKAREVTRLEPRSAAEIETKS